MAVGGHGLALPLPTGRRECWLLHHAGIFQLSWDDGRRRGKAWGILARGWLLLLLLLLLLLRRAGWEEDWNDDGCIEAGDLSGGGGE